MSRLTARLCSTKCSEFIISLRPSFWGYDHLFCNLLYHHYIWWKLKVMLHFQSKEYCWATLVKYLALGPSKICSKYFPATLEWQQKKEWAKTDNASFTMTIVWVCMCMQNYATEKYSLCQKATRTGYCWGHLKSILVFFSHIPLSQTAQSLCQQSSLGKWWNKNSYAPSSKTTNTFTTQKGNTLKQPYELLSCLSASFLKNVMILTGQKFFPQSTSVNPSPQMSPSRGRLGSNRFVGQKNTWTH